MRIFDLHCDTAYKLLKGYTAAVNADTVGGFDECTVCSALWIDDRESESKKLYKELLSASKKLDFDHILTVEGFSFAESTETVKMISADGVRSVGLTWNYNNKLAGGCLDDGNFTHFGKKIVNALNDADILTDLAHINEKSFFPVLDAAARPYISHGNLKKICEHPRNISDGEAFALAKRGGVLGICLYPAFLGGDVFERVYENIVTAEEMGLKAALGSDFDGADMDDRLKTPALLPDLYDFLVRKGFSNEMLDNFFYKNAYGLFYPEEEKQCNI